MKWYAWLFAFTTILACGLLLPGVQANAIAASVTTAFGVDTWVTAVVLTLLLAFIIFGGLKRIANFASAVVSFMAIAYIVVAFAIILLNITQVPTMFKRVISSAFGFEPAFGGILGMAVLWGVRRGVYSNEAGQGTAPHALRQPPFRTQPNRASCRHFLFTSIRCSSVLLRDSCCLSPVSTTWRIPPEPLYTPA